MRKITVSFNKWLLIAFLAVITSFCYGQTSKQEIVTNELVIKMYQARLSRALILSKIQYSPCTFDLSANGLIALKRAKIPDDIIKIMIARETGEQKNVLTSKANIEITPPKTLIVTETTIKKSTTPVSVAVINSLESGIYYYNYTAKECIELEPSVLTNMKTGGLGEALKRNMISPLINAKTRASLSNIKANVIIETTTPQFVFVFEKDQSKGINNSSTYIGSAQSPNEFFLVQMKVVKNSREVVVGLSNSISDNTGIDDKIKIPFNSKKLSNGSYEVTPQNPLLVGEYCFMFSSSSLNKGVTHKVYDFSIR